MINSKHHSKQYNQLQAKQFPHKTYKNSELRQYKKFRVDKELDLKYPCLEIKFCKSIPSLVSLFNFDNIHIYDITSSTIITKFPNIPDTITAGEFRSDGKVVFSGTESGTIVVHDVLNKNCLRKYTAHKLQINSLSIATDLVSFISTSNDCSFKLFDLSRTKPMREYIKAHDDYIRVSRYIDNNVILTGGYDKVIKQWDLREGDNNSTNARVISPNPSLTYANKNICDDILVINPTSFISTSDNRLMLFDIRKGDEIASVIPIQSNISKLIADSKLSRLFILAPNESFIKVLELKDLSMRSLFSINKKEQIGSFDISCDLNHYCLSYNSGKTEILSRNIEYKEDQVNALDIQKDKEEQQIELLIPSKYADKTVVKNYKYFNRGQYLKNVAEEDIYIAKEKKVRLQEHDKSLKTFEYHKALDSVIKGNNVEMILSVFEELMDRNVLKLALMNRSEEDVELILKFVLWKIRDVKAMTIVLYVFNLLVDYYLMFAVRSNVIKELFDKIQKEIDDEIVFEGELEKIKDDIESIGDIYTHLK